MFHPFKLLTLASGIKIYAEAQISFRFVDGGGLNVIGIHC